MFSSHTLITGGIFTQVVDNRQTNIVKSGFERLQDAVAPGAFHNSGERFNPPKCHANTRVAVLGKLMDWIIQQDPRTCNALVRWLYGPAGAGKSAIAQTLAEICHSENKFLASFFFSRNDPLRGTSRALVATLAYQLALNLPQQVHEHIVFAIAHDPLIFMGSLETQFLTLIVQPVKQLAVSGFFNTLGAPRLIIIDGLDECENPEVQCGILRAICRSINEQSIPLLFLITSCPETSISSFFNSQSTASILTRLTLDDSYNSRTDIRRFLDDKFQEIKHMHRLKEYIPVSWPTTDVIEMIVGKSSGQFIYASTVINFVGSPRRRPMDQLDIILGVLPVNGEAPFAELDALYTRIFSGVEDINHALQIIGLLILQPPEVHDDQNLEHFLSLNPGDISLILSDLGSLISVREWGSWGRHPRLRVLHASLKDFLLDASRSKELYINPVEKHTEYALCCFRHLNNNSADHDILHRLFYHCPPALVNQELWDNINRLSVEALMAAVEDSSWDEVPTVAWIPRFFDFLKSLKWDVDEHFYKHQLKLLDHFFMDRLDHYYRDQPFLLLVVAASNHHLVNFVGVPFALPKASRFIDNAELCLGRLYNHENLVLYSTMFNDFLKDPERSGKYFLDGAKYANAAICALTYLCNHWSHPLPSVYSDPDKDIRRSAPRRWREKRGRNSILFAVKIKHKARPGTQKYSYIHPPPYGRRHADDWRQIYFFNTQQNPYEEDVIARGVFRLALFNLPYLLEQSAKSEELFDFARRVQFGRRAKSYPKRTKLARKAIEGYLARFLDKI